MLKQANYLQIRVHWPDPVVVLAVAVLAVDPVVDNAEGGAVTVDNLYHWTK
jgi:hypothetical protein